MSALDEITKKYGKKLQRFKNDDQYPPIEYVSTGSMLLDEALGIGGFPVGRVSVIWGKESTGKTTLTLQTIANAQRKWPNKQVAYFDTEGVFEPQRGKTLGIDYDRFVFVTPDSGEQAWDITEALLRTKDFSIIAIDSVAALAPESEIEGDMDKSLVGTTARLTTKAMRKLGPIVVESDTILLLVNQVRVNLSGYGVPDTMPGGQALRHHASVIVKIGRSGWIEQGTEKIGLVTKAEIQKNKCAVPMKQCEFNIYFDSGISIEDELLIIGDSLNILVKSGAWYKYKGESVAQGGVKARTWLKEHPEVKEDILRAYRSSN